MYFCQFVNTPEFVVYSRDSPRTLAPPFRMPAPTTPLPLQYHGQIICAWQAYDHHPHPRGLWWLVGFCSVVFGIILSALWQGDFILALCFAIIIAFWAYYHHEGHQTHYVFVYDTTLQIDADAIPLGDVIGYWIVHQPAVHVIYFDIQAKYHRYTIPVQMGSRSPEWFRQHLGQAGLTELTDRRESLTQIWARALQL